MTKEQIEEIDDVYLRLLYKGEVLEGLSSVLDSVEEFELAYDNPVRKKITALKVILEDTAGEITGLARRLDVVILHSDRAAAA